MRNILKTADRRAKRMEILCTAYVGYFSCLIILVQFGVIRCTLQNFRRKDFQNAPAPPVFTQFQPNFIVSMLVTREYSLLHFWQCPKFEKFMAL